MDRRDLLRRGGAAAGIGLVTPTVISLTATPAYAAAGSNVAILLDDFSNTTAGTVPNFVFGGARETRNSVTLTPGQAVLGGDSILDPGGMLIYGAGLSGDLFDPALNVSGCSKLCSTGAAGLNVVIRSASNAHQSGTADASGCVQLSDFAGVDMTSIVNVAIENYSPNPVTITRVEFV